MEKKKIFETLGTVAVTIVAIAVGTLLVSVTLTLMYNMVAALFD